jgi:hypothetical protein
MTEHKVQLLPLGGKRQFSQEMREWQAGFPPVRRWAVNLVT